VDGKNILGNCQACFDGFEKWIKAGQLAILQC
jgi:hypothetical protein